MDIAARCPWEPGRPTNPARDTATPLGGQGNDEQVGTRARRYHPPNRTPESGAIT
jgi:hypothetical protein